MSIKYRAQFLVDKEKNNSTGKLRYRIKWNGNIVAFNLGYRVEIEKWSTESQRCKINTTHGAKKISSTLINRKIHNYEIAAEEVFSELASNKPHFTPDDFRLAFNIKIGKKEKHAAAKNFFQIYDEFAYEESKLNQWTPSTKDKIQSIKNHLEKFNPNLGFEYFTEEGLFEYQLYLQNNLKFKNSTILKHFSFLRWFLKWASKKNYNQYTTYAFYKPKLKSTQKKVIFLTQEELKKLESCVIPAEKKYLERIRDVFIFQCFSGLRYSDVANLKRSDVRKNHIEITTMKTADSLRIELNKHTKEILGKYKNEVFHNDLALPVISNQKMNDYLKELAALAEINEPIRETYYIGNKRIDEVTPKYALLGTHAGRRTFICNALALGISPQIVMKWTGHSDYKAMKPYIDIADEIKAKAMTKFDSL